jgi:electron transport complex protein RnfE
VSIETSAKLQRSLLLLGLCPLLAVTDTAIKAATLALIALVAFLITAVAVALLRRWLRPETELPASVMILAGIVTACELAANAWAHSLYVELGIYLPLVVAHGAILTQVRAVAMRASIGAAGKDALVIGGSQALVFTLLGAIREALGHGALLHDAGTLLGPWAEPLTLPILPFDSGWLLVAAPPGALLTLGLLIAAGNWLMARRHGSVAAEASPAPKI